MIIAGNDCSNLKARRMDGFSYQELVRSEAFDGMEISMICLAHIFDMVIAAISGETFWVSRNTLKFNEIAIIVGLNADGHVYSTGNYDFWVRIAFLV